MVYEWRRTMLVCRSYLCTYIEPDYILVYVAIVLRFGGSKRRSHLCVNTTNLGDLLVLETCHSILDQALESTTRSDTDECWEHSEEPLLESVMVNYGTVRHLYMNWISPNTL